MKTVADVLRVMGEGGYFSIATKEVVAVVDKLFNQIIQVVRAEQGLPPSDNLHEIALSTELAGGSQELLSLMERTLARASSSSRVVCA